MQIGWSHNFSSFVSRRWPLVANNRPAFGCKSESLDFMQSHAIQYKHNVITVQLFFIFLFSVLFSYEPELHPAATYRIKQLKATIQVFSTGSITVTGTERRLVCTEIDRQTDAQLRCSAYFQRARVPRGFRPSCKVVGTVLSQKHSFVNLFPQGMPSFQSVCNISRDAFLQIAVENARWRFSCSVFVFTWREVARLHRVVGFTVAQHVTPENCMRACLPFHLLLLFHRCIRQLCPR